MDRDLLAQSMFFELKRVWAITALLVLGIVLTCVPIAIASSQETSRLESAQAEGTVFLQPSNGTNWTGDCSDTGECTQDSPCSVFTSELLVNGSSSCTLVFTEGVYGPLNVTSNADLVYGFIGTVASLNLTTQASSVKYSRFGGESSTATLQGSLQTIDLSNDDSISLVLDSMAFTETKFLLSSESVYSSALNIDITTSTFSLLSGSAALFEIDVPEGSVSGTASFLMKSSSVLLPSSLTASLLSSTLSFGQLEISNHSKLDSALHVFQVPSSGLRSIQISKSTVSGFTTFVTAPAGNAHASFVNASLIISDSNLSGATSPHYALTSSKRSLSDPVPSPIISIPLSIPSFNPSSCMQMVLNGSRVSNLNVNCFNSTHEASHQACSVTIEKSSLFQNLLCVLGTPTSPATATIYNSTIHTQGYVGKSQVHSATRLKDAQIDAREVLFEAYSQESQSLCRPPIFEGLVTFSPQSHVTFSAMGFLSGRVQLSNLTQRNGEVFFFAPPFGESESDSVLEPLPGDGPSHWTWITPWSARYMAGSYANATRTFDVTRLRRLELVLTVNSIFVVGPAIPLHAAEILSRNFTAFMESFELVWPDNLDPMRSASYTLGSFTFPSNITTNETRLTSHTGDRWLWDATFTVNSPTARSWFFDIKAAGLAPVSTPSTSSTPSSNPCGDVSPRPGNWTCENQKWVHSTPLNVSGDLILPKASHSVVNGALNVSGNIVFADYSSSLQSLRCITLLSNRSSILFDLSSSDAVPSELGTRRDPSWYATVLFQEPSCAGSVQHFKLQVKNAPSCRKIQASHGDSTPSVLKVNFKADFEICNTTYIVLGCSSGAILLLVLLGALIWCCCRDIKRPGYERLPSKPTSTSLLDDDLPNWTN